METAFTQERFGQYLLLSHLGRGGMADVYKARVEGVAGFARHVVVKRILKVHTEEPHFVEMFINEAKIAARLSHPNVVGVYELGEVEGELFMALEYVRGQDLLRVMRASAQAGEATPPPQIAAYIVREIGKALAHAHDHIDENGAPRPIIHRDVSPQNVMVAYDGQVKLVDFGIAKAVTAYNEVTHTGSLKGKFGYMAPEQIDTGICTPQTDVFSAGVVLHEVLTARRLFKGQTDYDTMTKVKTAPLQPPSSLNPNVHPVLDRITMTALDRDVSRRYQRAAQLVRDLDDYLLSVRFGAEDLRAWLDRVIPATERDDGDSQAVALPASGTPSRSRPSGSAGPKASQAVATVAATGASQASRRAKLLSAAQAGESFGDLDGAALVAEANLRPPALSEASSSLSIASGARPPLDRDAAARRRPLVFGVVALAFLASMGSVWLILRPGPPQAEVLHPVAQPPEPKEADVTRAPRPAPPSPEAAAATPRVRLDSEPSGAVVYAGPRRLGQTPLQIDVPGGTLDITLSYAGRPELRYTLRSADGAEQLLRIEEERRRSRRRKDGRDPSAPVPGVASPSAPPPVQPAAPTPQPAAPQPPKKKLNVQILDEDERPAAGKPAGKVKALDD